MFESPLYVIPATSALRVWLVRVVDHPRFDQCVLVVIMLNAIVEVLEIPSMEDYVWARAVVQVDVAFLALFCVEAMLKIGALGFAFDRWSYMRDPWNVCDFIIVFLGVVSELFDGSKLSVIRLVRLMRPLRAIRRIRGMRVLVNTLVQSLPMMADVVCLLVLVMYVFAVLGIQMWKGALHQRCYVWATNPGDFFLNPEDTEICGGSRVCEEVPGFNVECAVHTNVVSETVLNFDTIWYAMLLVFKVVTLDDWPADMNNVQDASSRFAWVYFVLLTLLGGYFCLNLVLAILAVVYTEAQRAKLSEVVTRVIPQAAIPSALTTAERGIAKRVVEAYRKEVEERNRIEGKARNQTLSGGNSRRETKRLLLRAFAPATSSYAYEQEKKKADDDEESEEEKPEAENYRFVPTALSCASVAGMQLVKALGAFAAPLALLPPEADDDDGSDSDSAEILTDDSSTVATRPPSGAGSDFSSSAAAEASVRRRFWACRKPFRALAENPWLNRFMLGITVVNVVMMATDHFGAPPAQLAAIDGTNLIASWCFLFEMIFKIVGLGPAKYFRDGYNTLDCVLVLLSLPEMLSLASNLSSFAAFRAFRGFRLMVRIRPLRETVTGIALSFRAVLWLLVLMMLLIFIYAMLGLSLFRNAYGEEDRENFRSLWEAGLTVFIVITGDSWATIMRRAIDGTNEAAFLFFVSLFCIGNLMLTNLFIAILIDHFKVVTDDGAEEPKALPAKPPGAKRGGIAGEEPLEKDGVALGGAAAQVMAPVAIDPERMAAVAMASGRESPEGGGRRRRLAAWDQGAIVTREHFADASRNPAVPRPGAAATVSSQLSTSASAVDSSQSSDVDESGEGEPDDAKRRQLDNKPLTVRFGATHVDADIESASGRSSSTGAAAPFRFCRDAAGLSYEEWRARHAKGWRVSISRRQGRPYWWRGDDAGVKLWTCPVSASDELPLTDAERAQLDVVCSAEGLPSDEMEKLVTDRMSDCPGTGGGGFTNFSPFRPSIGEYRRHMRGTWAESLGSVDSGNLRLFACCATRRTMQFVEAVWRQGGQRKRLFLQHLADAGALCPSKQPPPFAPADGGSDDGAEQAGGAAVYRSDCGSSSSLSRRDSIFWMANAPDQPAPDGWEDCLAAAAPRALGLIGRGNTARRAFARVVYHKDAENVMVLVILVNAVFLALDDAHADERPGGKRLLEVMNYVFIGLYLAELTVKVVACGLHGGWVERLEDGTRSNGYLKEPWNKVDALVCFSLVFDLMGVPFANKLRCARTLRVLIRFEALRVVVMALLRATPQIVYVCVVCLFVWVVYGILGVQLFKGEFSACSDPSVLDLPSCTGTYLVSAPTAADPSAMVVQERVWEYDRAHFDHLGMAFLTLFEIAVVEDWAPIMWRAVDADGFGKTAVNAHPERSLFFVTFVIVGNFFCVNLFVGSLINRFNSDMETLLTRSQAKDAAFNRLLELYSMEAVPLPPVNPVRSACFKLVNKEHFDTVVLSMILLNCLFLGSEHYDSTPAWDTVLRVVNFVFAGVFAVEAAVKMLAYGMTQYFGEAWNRFDFLCVAMSLVGITFSNVNTGAFRVIRVFRAFRLLKRARRLEMLFHTLLRSLPSLGNIVLLLGYVFFNWGVIGVEMFKNVKPNPDLGRHNSFRTLPEAILVLYQVGTTETWMSVMNGVSLVPPDCDEQLGDCGKTWGHFVFFVSYMVVGSFIFMNLFIFVVLHNFENDRLDIQEQETDSQRGDVHRGFAVLKKTWARAVALQNTAQRIPAHNNRLDVATFLNVVQALPEPIWRRPVRVFLRTASAVKWLTLLRNIKSLPIAIPLYKPRKHRGQYQVEYADVLKALSMRVVGLRNEDVFGVYFVHSRGDRNFTLVQLLGAMRLITIWKERKRIIGEGIKAKRAMLAMQAVRRLKMFAQYADTPEGQTDHAAISKVFKLINEAQTAQQPAPPKRINGGNKLSHMLLHRMKARVPKNPDPAPPAGRPPDPSGSPLSSLGNPINALFGAESSQHGDGLPRGELLYCPPALGPAAAAAAAPSGFAAPPHNTP
eukprot:gene17024-26121_t